MKLSKSILTVLLMLLPVLSYAQDMMADHVAKSPNETNPIKIGQSIPDIELVDDMGKMVSTHEIAKQKPTIFVMYRGGWCPYCSTQLSALAKLKKDILARGYQIVGIATEDFASQKEFSENKDISYRLYSDRHHQFSKALGIAYYLDDKTLSDYKSFGVKIVDGILPVPTVILTDTDGKVNFIYSNPDYTERLSEEVLLAVINAD